MAIHPDLKRAVPKTKNTAKDYNDNFDKMINFVDATLLECKTYVDAYMPDQSGQAGKFLTTNGTIASWVNLGLYIPAASYIDGLVITKVNDTTIGVSSGSCFDNTKTIILSLATDVTKQNENQASNATYYVYIIGTGSSTDILISSSSSSPTLPSGYIYQRQIGYFTTDADGNIESVAYYGVPSNSDKSTQGSFLPDYSAQVELSNITSDTTIIKNGWIEINCGVSPGSVTLTLNGTTRTINYTSSNQRLALFLPVAKNDVFKLGFASGNSAQVYFYPMRSN